MKPVILVMFSCRGPAMIRYADIRLLEKEWGISARFTGIVRGQTQVKRSTDKDERTKRRDL